MTLISCCFVPNGIALSGDSRTTGTLTVQTPQPTTANPQATVPTRTPWVVSDSARKVFVVHDRVAVGSWGDAMILDMPIAHHIAAFAIANPLQPTSTVEQLTDSILAHFRAIAPSAMTGFVVAGYDGPDPYVYEINVGLNMKKRWNVDPASGKTTYAVFYGGDYDILTRLLSNPSTNPAFNLLNLQDAVDFSRHLIRTTIDQMRFEPRFPTVGGHIDTVTLTPNRTKFLVRKELHA